MYHIIANASESPIPCSIPIAFSYPLLTDLSLNLAPCHTDGGPDHIDNYLFAIGGSHVLDEVFTSLCSLPHVTLQPIDDFSFFPPLPFKHAGGNRMQSRAPFPKLLGIFIPDFTCLTRMESLITLRRSSVKRSSCSRS